MFRNVIFLFVSFSIFGCASNGPVDSRAMNEIQQTLVAIQTDLNKTAAQVSELKADFDKLTKANQPPPPPDLSKIGLDDDPVMGDENAQIAIVEFSDFECPYCAGFHQQSFGKVKKDYIDSGKVKFIYRDMPLDFHAQAEGAAIVAYCAGDQGKYYEMHDLLFKNSKKLGDGLYDKLAMDLKLDQDKFEDCRNGTAAKKEVRSDLADAQNIGQFGTPAFFIGTVKDNKLTNVIYLAGAQSPVAISRAVDHLMEKYVSVKTASN